MAQEDYVIADQTGVSFLADLNNTLAAIVSNNSGATEPATMYAYQLWADTNAGILKQRNSANNAWINILTLAGIKSSDIRNTAAGNISATTVQAALNELDTKKSALSGADFTGPAKSTAGDFNLVSSTALSDAAATLTAAQLIGGEFTITPTVARIQTLDTAANIISALSGSVDGSNFEFTVVNLAAFDVTVATATGVTLVGNMVVNSGNATFRARRLSASTISVTRKETVDFIGLSKAWLFFDGTGALSIRKSYNVSSITDIAVGRYFANFTQPMPDANYPTVASALSTTDGANRVATSSAVSATQAYVNTVIASSGVNFDTEFNSLVVFSE